MLMIATGLRTDVDARKNVAIWCVAHQLQCTLRDSCEIIALLAQRTAYFSDWLFHFICIRNSIAIYETAIMFVSFARALFLPSFLLRIYEYYTRSAYIFEWREYLHDLRGLEDAWIYVLRQFRKYVYICLLYRAGEIYVARWTLCEFVRRVLCYERD